MSLTVTWTLIFIQDFWEGRTAFFHCHIRFHRQHTRQTRAGLWESESCSPQDFRQRRAEEYSSGAAATFPQCNDPNTTTVHVQAFFYSGLAISIFAASVVMLDKQWLDRDARVEMRGSVINRSRYRQRKMDWMVTWHFDLVMERSPLVLQAALLLIDRAPSDYLCIDKVVVSIFIGLTAFGLLFYILIISAANTPPPDSLQK